MSLTLHHFEAKGWTKASWNKIKNEQGKKLEPLDWISWSLLAFDLALGAGAVALHISFFGDVWACVLSVVMLVLTFLHLYLLVHEACHDALFRSRKLNDFVGQLLGWVIALAYLPRKRSHNLHHLHTGHPVLDPANKRIIERFSVFTEREKNTLEFIWRNWLPLIVINDRVGLALSPFVRVEERRDLKAVKRERRWTWIYLAGYATAITGLFWFGLGYLLLTLYFPTLWLACMAEEMVNLPHHGETPLLRADEKSLPYWRQHLLTHSCSSVPFWSRWVLLNFNLHTAHHFYPWAPWYRLGAIHDAILQYPELTSDGQLQQNEIRWSVEKRRRPLLEFMGHYLDRSDSEIERTADHIDLAS